MNKLKEYSINLYCTYNIGTDRISPTSSGLLSHMLSVKGKLEVFSFSNVTYTVKKVVVALQIHHNTEM